MADTRRNQCHPFRTKNTVYHYYDGLSVDSTRCYAARMQIMATGLSGSFSAGLPSSLSQEQRSRRSSLFCWFVIKCILLLNLGRCHASRRGAVRASPTLESRQLAAGGNLVIKVQRGNSACSVQKDITLLGREGELLGSDYKV